MPNPQKHRSSESHLHLVQPAEKSVGFFESIPMPVRRTLLGLAAGAAVVAGVFELSSRMQEGSGPAENPALVHPNDGYKPYNVRQNDTLSRIVNLAYPNIEPYGSEWNKKIGELDRQLPSDDQILGQIHPGETLQLDPDANLKHLEQVENRLHK